MKKNIILIITLLFILFFGTGCATKMNVKVNEKINIHKNINSEIIGYFDTSKINYNKLYYYTQVIFDPFNKNKITLFDERKATKWNIRCEAHYKACLSELQMSDDYRYATTANGFSLPVSESDLKECLGISNNKNYFYKKHGPCSNMSGSVVFIKRTRHKLNNPVEIDEYYPLASYKIESYNNGYYNSHLNSGIIGITYIEKNKMVLYITYSKNYSIKKLEKIKTILINKFKRKGFILIKNPNTILIYPSEIYNNLY